MLRPLPEDSFREDYIEKEWTRLKEAKRQSTMSLAEEIQQAEEQHANGQLTDAELEVMRIKIDAEEGFNNLQTHGQAAEAESQRLVLPQANGQEAESL